MKTKFAMIIGLAAIVVGIAIGCASIQKGEDPLVVNVERAQTIAPPTFDLVLSTDDSARALWRSKAPAFHDFAEWLRVRQVAYVNDTPTNVQRSIALQLNLDKVKLDYKAARASSNDLFTALVTLQSAMNQANAWLMVVTNPAPAVILMPPNN